MGTGDVKTANALRDLTLPGYQGKVQPEEAKPVEAKAEAAEVKAATLSQSQKTGAGLRFAKTSALRGKVTTQWTLPNGLDTQWDAASECTHLSRVDNKAACKARKWSDAVEAHKDHPIRPSPDERIQNSGRMCKWIPGKGKTGKCESDYCVGKPKSVCPHSDGQWPIYEEVGGKVVLKDVRCKWEKTSLLTGTCVADAEKQAAADKQAQSTEGMAVAQLGGLLAHRKTEEKKATEKEDKRMAELDRNRKRRY